MDNFGSRFRRQAREKLKQTASSYSSHGKIKSNYWREP